MIFSQLHKDNFYKAIESLKKYRRAELKDEQGRSLLKELYVDLLPENFILKKSIQPNTTFLVGRKGTGKSTIFLRIEEELKSQKNILPVYLDAKTIFESSQLNIQAIDNQSLFSEYYKKYIWQYHFIKAFLTKIFEKIENNYISKKSIRNFFVGDLDKDYVEEQLNNIKKDLLGNDCFNIIPFPTFEEKIKQISSTSSSEKLVTAPKLNATASLADPNIQVTLESTNTQKTDSSHIEINEELSNTLLHTFNIQDIIEKIKNILCKIKIHHTFILLDDFSELDDDSIKYFTDVIISPLNNWSEEFIKFKIAAYPNRIYYGKIDSTKVDTIDLDFYKLFSSHNKDDMESLATTFTSRLLTARANHFLKTNIDMFFDTSKTTMDEYYHLLFQTSFNVPRILGYILVNCYESNIIHDKPITKQAIKNASQKYYEDKLQVYFNRSTYSLASIEEKINNLQLQELLNLFINRSKDIKNKILTKELSGKNYNVTEPCSSHFHIDSRYEEYIKTLELNFFINKYGELKDRDRRNVSIYCLNYGLCEKQSLIFGSPTTGTTHRKYFIERPFNYNKIISTFLDNLTKIECDRCHKTYNQDELKFLQWNNFKCNSCSGSVITTYIDEDLKEKIKAIEADDMLPIEELEIIREN